MAWWCSVSAVEVTVVFKFCSSLPQVLVLVAVPVPVRCSSSPRLELRRSCQWMVQNSN